MPSFTPTPILLVLILLGFAQVSVQGDSSITNSIPRTESFDLAETAMAGGSEGQIPLFLYRPLSQNHHSVSPRGLLLLIPGHNGSGAAMLDERWRQFADQHQLVLLAPTFISSNPEELHHHQGYYYPAVGSGAAIEAALAETHQRIWMRTDKI